MTYTTAKAAEKIGISAHTLRFYDKEGLLPNIGRDEYGNRCFTDNDLQWLYLLQCLKNTGMSLKRHQTLCGMYRHWRRYH